MPLHVQGNKKYMLSTDCGKISLASSIYGRHIFVYHFFEGDQFVLDKESLDVIFQPPEVNAIQEMQLADGNGRIIEKKYIPSSDIKKITLRIALKNTFDEGQILVLPNDYISCAGTALIRDTIRISK